MHYTNTRSKVLIKEIIAAIIGSLGVIGRSLTPKLIALNYQLHLINRRIPEGEANHPTFFRGYFQCVLFISRVKRCYLITNLATAIPKPGQSWELNDKIRREGTVNIIKACKQLKIKCYIQQSIAMLHKNHNEEWADESSAFQPNAATQSAADMEALMF